MDVTYAIIQKPRRGGGATGRDPAPFTRDPAPLGPGPAPSGPASLPGSPVRRPSPTPAAAPQPADGAYEVVTPQGDVSSPARLGFNFRIGKPRGPRDPPAQWSQG